MPRANVAEVVEERYGPWLRAIEAHAKVRGISLDAATRVRLAKLFAENGVDSACVGEYLDHVDFNAKEDPVEKLRSLLISEAPQLTKEEELLREYSWLVNVYVDLIDNGDLENAEAVKERLIELYNTLGRKYPHLARPWLERPEVPAETEVEPKAEPAELPKVEPEVELKPVELPKVEPKAELPKAEPRVEVEVLPPLRPYVRYYPRRRRPEVEGTVDISEILRPLTHPAVRKPRVPKAKGAQVRSQRRTVAKAQPKRTQRKEDPAVLAARRLGKLIGAVFSLY